jgi:hypothetical protein
VRQAGMLHAFVVPLLFSTVGVEAEFNSAGRTGYQPVFLCVSHLVIPSAVEESLAILFL